MARRCVLGGFVTSFVSPKTYDLGVKKNRFDERVLLSSQNLGFGCIHSTEKLCSSNSKELF